MPYLGTFGLEFQKTIVIFEIGTLEFVKNESLTHTINFGIGSALSKGPGVRFFGRSGSGSGSALQSMPCETICHVQKLCYYS